MNKTKIEWCDFTWNPVVGCTHGCDYCYARRFAKRLKCPQCSAFVPHLHPERLDQPATVKTPSIIFCGSMCDMFDRNLPAAAFGCVAAAMGAARHHSFIALTKQPEYASYQLRNVADLNNLWLGVSVTTGNDIWRFDALLSVWAGGTVISYEPCLAPIAFPTRGLNWLIIGAQTGPGAVRPECSWIADAISGARDAGIPVFVKHNVVKYFPEFAGLREWPKGMKK